MVCRVRQIWKGRVKVHCVCGKGGEMSGLCVWGGWWDELDCVWEEGDEMSWIVCGRRVVRWVDSVCFNVCVGRVVRWWGGIINDISPGSPGDGTGHIPLLWPQHEWSREKVCTATLCVDTVHLKHLILDTAKLIQNSWSLALPNSFWSALWCVTFFLPAIGRQVRLRGWGRYEIQLREWNTEPLRGISPLSKSWRYMYCKHRNIGDTFNLAVWRWATKSTNLKLPTFLCTQN